MTKQKNVWPYAKRLQELGYPTRLATQMNLSWDTECEANLESPGGKSKTTTRDNWIEHQINEMIKNIKNKKGKNNENEITNTTTRITKPTNLGELK